MWVARAPVPLRARLKRSDEYMRRRTCHWVATPDAKKLLPGTVRKVAQAMLLLAVHFWTGGICSVVTGLGRAKMFKPRSK
jgi:hypothetical protein